MIQRGDVVWVDLGPIHDRAPAKRRPVLVVQADTHNRSALGTTIVVALTSNTARAAFPGNVFLPAAVTGLSKDSVAVVTELVTIDRDRLGVALGNVPPTLMADVDKGLRRALQL